MTALSASHAATTAKKWFASFDALLTLLRWAIVYHEYLDYVCFNLQTLALVNLLSQLMLFFLLKKQIAEGNENQGGGLGEGGVSNTGHATSESHVSRAPRLKLINWYAGRESSTLAKELYGGELGQHATPDEVGFNGLFIFGIWYMVSRA